MAITADMPRWLIQLEAITDHIAEDDDWLLIIPEGRLKILKTGDDHGSRIFVVTLTRPGSDRPNEQYFIDPTGVIGAEFEFPSSLPYPPADIDYPAYQTDEQRRELAQRRARLIVKFIEERLPIGENQ